MVTAEGHEADDVLATLARRGAEQDYEVLVFSGDRDAFQMIDEHVTVVYPGRTPSDLKHMDAAAVVERHPGRARRGVEERVEQRPVRHGIAAITHRLGLAVR